MLKMAGAWSVGVQSSVPSAVDDLPLPNIFLPTNNNPWHANARRLVIVKGTPPMKMLTPIATTMSVAAPYWELRPCACGPCSLGEGGA